MNIFLYLQKIPHREIYFISLILLGISLPVAPIGVSISQFILLGNWLLERNFNEKFAMLRNKTDLTIFLGLFLVHFVFLIPTENFSYAFHDIKIKLPIFVLPLIIGTSKPLNIKQLQIILFFFAASVVTATFIGLFYNFFIPHTDSRSLSLFISHIRFSLLINIAIFSLIYFFLNKNTYLSRFQRVTMIFAILWLTLFLFILNSITGIIVFFILSQIFLLIFLKQINSLIFKRIIIFSTIFIPFLILFYLIFQVKNFYNVDKIENLEKFSKKGNVYSHETSNLQIENGHFVWIYFCETELREEWNKRSKFLYDGKDKHGQEIRFTLIRYLTSKNLRKDAESVNSLTIKDIENIENGLANVIYEKKYNISSRIYELIWEFDEAKRTGNLNGHSFTQRFEYLRVAFNIIAEHFFFGTGTGDVQDEFEKQYAKMKTSLEKKWQLRTHNQLVTFFVSFGIFGFLFCVFSILFPIFNEKKYRDFFVKLIILVTFLSFLNEDTLETQAGATFFAYFYALFVFGKDFSQNFRDNIAFEAARLSKTK